MYTTFTLVLPESELLGAAAGDGELNQSVTALVSSCASVTVDLGPLHIVGFGKVPIAAMP